MNDRSVRQALWWVMMAAAGAESTPSSTPCATIVEPAASASGAARNGLATIAVLSKFSCTYSRKCGISVMVMILITNRRQRIPMPMLSCS